MSKPDERVAEALATIGAVSRAVSRSLDIDEVLAILSSEMETRLGIPSGAIFLRNDIDHAVFRRGWGEYEELREFEPYLRSPTADSSPMLADRRTAAKALAWSGVVAIPLLTRRQQHGVVIIGTRLSGGFDPAHIDLYRTIGREVSIAVENARLFAEVSRSNERLQELSRKLFEVQEQERRHLGRELHDQIGQILTGLKLAIENARAEAGSAEHLEEAERLVIDLLQRVRSLSVELRPPLLDDAGLVPALAAHVERLSASCGISIDLRQSVQAELHPDIETAAFRIVQEGLTNVVRHGCTATARVRIWTTAECLMLFIADDGAGFDVETFSHGGSGIRGMEERAALIGGLMQIDSAVGAGTRISVELPLAISGR